MFAFAVTSVITASPFSMAILIPCRSELRTNANAIAFTTDELRRANYFT